VCHRTRHWNQVGFRANAVAPMRRRDFMLLSGAAAAWPLAARAQQAALPVVGYFYPGLEDNDYLTPAFRKGLAEAGFVEGRNVVIEYRFGRNDLSRTPELLADLVRRRVTVIAVTGGGPSVRAQGSDLNHSNRLRNWRRPGGSRPRRQLQLAGRQPHRCNH
jgi:hypothetical protein